jgi:hypothetical protein
VECLEDRCLLSQGGLGNLLPNISYHGGPLLQNVQVESVYDGSAWNTNATLQQLVPQVDGFLQYFVTSPYMDVLKQYNVGDGTFTGHDVVAQGLGSQVSDSQIRSTLNAQINSGQLAAPNANSLYVVFAPPGVVVTANGQNSISNFAGYHDVFTDSAGAPVYYAVIPFPTGNVSSQQLNPFQQMTLTLSHELAESITDPDTQTGWLDPQRGEIGDVAEGVVGLLNGYVVQAVWSNAAGQAVVPSASSTTTSNLHVSGANIQTTAGQAFTGVVATITGADPTATADSFTATIDWGDGNTSNGMIAADASGGFDVGGTHTYTQAGWYPVTVTVKDANNNVVGTVLDKASVAAAPPTLRVHGAPIKATADQQFSGVVAHFTDVNTSATASDFTATINWGDGTTSTGTITADPKGGFDVSGTHTYASSSPDGASAFGGFGFGLPDNVLGDQFFVVATTVTDTLANTSAKALSLAVVAPAPPDITAKGKNIQATSGTAFTGTVATFTSTDTAATASSFTATIDWGDGTTSTGTITADPKGGFDVSGTHTYTDADDIFSFFFGPRTHQFVIHVAITDTLTNDKAITESLATVAPTAPNLAVTAQNITATSGQQFSGQVATFTDVNTSATASDFTATINWGDGTTSTGTITADPKGGFDVSGTHTYTLDNDLAPVWGGSSFGVNGASFRLKVTVHSKTSSDVGTGQAVASVTPAPPDVQAAGQQIDAVFGTEFSGTVATFTATSATATASDFTATINWGDGTTSTGTITADPNGGFDVTGTHTYTNTGDGDVGSDWPGASHDSLIHIPGLGSGAEAFVVTTTIQDTATSSTAKAVSLATVTPTTPNITTSSDTIHATAGQQFSGAVASFTDSDGAGASHFTATIDWGDGHRSTGTLTANASGGFDVSGTHTYKHGGTFHVLVRIRDTDGDSAVNLSTAIVADGTLPSTLPVVCQNLVNSFEHFADIIAQDYQQFLGRLPSQAEVNGWVGAMQGGATDEQVQAGFVASPEFFQHAGGTAQDWVNAMYQNLLGRTPDAWGQGVWLQALATGASPTSIADGILTSPEREGIVVQSDYKTYLGRTAATSEVSNWVNAFTAGVSNEQIVTGFLSSPEYFQQHNGNAHDWLFSAYQTLLSRQPDQTGLNAWLGVLGDNQQ